TPEGRGSAAGIAGRVQGRHCRPFCQVERRSVKVVEKDERRCVEIRHSQECQRECQDCGQVVRGEYLIFLTDGWPSCFHVFPFLSSSGSLERTWPGPVYRSI